MQKICRLSVMALMAALGWHAAQPAQAAPPLTAVTSQWGSVLKADAAAARALIIDSHPGAVDAENPGFNAVLQRAYAQVLARSARANTYAHYYWAMQSFAAAFDDGHLAVLGTTADSAKSLVHAWPGFATSLQDDEQRVVLSERPGAPPVGAQLVSCDGIRADDFAAQRLGPVVGRWGLQSVQLRASPSLFLRTDDPYHPRARRCVFEQAGVRRTHPMVWRAINAERYAALLEAAKPPPVKPLIGVTALADGGLWVGLGSSDSDPSSSDGVQLTELVHALDQQRAQIRQAPWIVIDLRGNRGGSSRWAQRVAAAIWGQTEMMARSPLDAGVDWRVSDGNIAHVETLKKMFTQAQDQDAALLAWVEQLRAGLLQAKAGGQPFWHEDADPPAAVPAAPLTPLITGKAYVLTGPGCGSSCLDAVDIFKNLGAIHLGRETGADTFYLDIRQPMLPSGLSTLALPIKVYRGRARGSNVSLKPRPEHAWAGDISDTPALQTWVQSLP